MGGQMTLRDREIARALLVRRVDCQKEIIRMLSVSYTHLDVYKRQPLLHSHRSGGAVKKEETTPPAGGAAVWRPVAKRSPFCPGSARGYLRRLCPYGQLQWRL